MSTERETAHVRLVASPLELGAALGRLEQQLPGNADLQTLRDSIVSQGGREEDPVALLIERAVDPIWKEAVEAYKRDVAQREADVAARAALARAYEKRTEEYRAIRTRALPWLLGPVTVILLAIAYAFAAWLGVDPGVLREVSDAMPGPAGM